VTADPWEALSGHAKDVFAAVPELAARGDATVEALEKHLLGPPDPAAFAKRIAQLDDADFEVRGRAQRELEESPEWIEGAVREAAEGSESAEVRARAQAILEVRTVLLPSSEFDRRGVRAVALLERIGSPRAREVLERLVRSAPRCVRREAKGALARLSLR